MLIKNVTVITPTGPLERGWLSWQGKKITRIGAGEAPAFDDIIDGQRLTLLPGFIDIHVHGADGVEVMDGQPDNLRHLAKFFAQYGVTAFLPTTWTDTRERTLAALKVVAEMQGPQEGGATILGAHLEGPYLNPLRGGAQNNEYIRRADRDEALQFLDMKVIRLVALAPEFEENLWLIDECVKRGIRVSAAHTNATYEEIRDAVRRGLTHATHTFNAMSGLHHRDPGTLGAVMTIPQIACELIADNIHVHPAAMKLLAGAKGTDGIILITDAVRAAGLPDGDYLLDERTIHLKDGAVQLDDGTLAGSTLTMNRALKNFLAACGLPLDAAWRPSSLNPARAVHVSDRKGSLEVGKDADLVLVDDDLHVQLTVAEGQIVYRA